MMWQTVQFLFFKTLMFGFAMTLMACASHQDKETQSAEEFRYDRSKKMKKQSI